MINNNVSQSNINIGRTLKSQSKITATASSETSTTNSSSYLSNTTIGLEKGQIMKGEVVDLRSDEVSVKLEDGRILTGKLEEGNQLSIGENVTFRVEEVSLKSLSLKILSESSVTLQDNTIDKALEAAGISKNSRNRTIVKALLNQQMPIDKSTIGLLIKQSIEFKDTPIDTLVFMNKYHIPVTKENIDFLRSLSNSEQNIVKDISNLIQEIPNLFEELSSLPSSALITKGNDLLNIILNNQMLNEYIENHEESTTYQYSDITETADAAFNHSQILKQSNVLDSTRTPDTLVSLLDKSIVSMEDRFMLIEYLASDPSAQMLFSENTLQRIMDGTATMSEVVPLLNETIQSNSFSDTNNRMNGKIQSTIMHVLSTYEAIQNNTQVNQLNTYLSASERMSLLQNLDDFSLPKDVKNLIQTGNIATHELLQWIQNKLSTATESSISKLFSSKEYNMLIKEELISKWTLPAKSLTKEGSIDHYYENLTKQLNNIKEFATTSYQNSNDSFYEQSAQLQKNISFINHINDFFTYFQLPIKLKEQIANSKLFVYTRKKEKRTAIDGISVLLHLDMEHLGPLDIHIDLHNSNIVSRFYMNDKEISNLISSNMPLLETALVKKGYTLDAEVIIREKDINIVEEFIKQEEDFSSVYRYNFDIRA